jgi:phytoene dehydrogenase-like protein
VINMSDHHSPTPNGQPDHDVIVIGAGLAGLTAAIALQQRGRQVLLLERRNAVGGLCGTVVVNGYEFTLACNDFGSGIHRVMAELGVRVQLRDTHTIIHCGRETYALPPNPRTLVNIIRHAPDVLRLVRALRDPAVEQTYGYLGPLLDKCVRSTPFADFVCSTSYGFGVVPGNHRIDWFKQLFAKEPDYGYGKTVAPVGGTQVLADAMAARFVQLGGQLEVGTEVLDIQDTGDDKVVTTTDGVYLGRDLVSSQGRLKDYPGDAKPGLAIGTLRLAILPGVRFPAGVHTLAYFPPGATRWLNQLEAGELPEQFGFHIFPCDTDAPHDHRAFNVYFYCPRGMDEFDAVTASRIQDYLLNRLERMLPGLPAGVLFQQLVSPARFLKEQKLSSHPSRAITPMGINKPDIYDPDQDIYYVGNTAGPPGEHAGAAMLSGLQAAQALSAAGHPVR